MKALSAALTSMFTPAIPKPPKARHKVSTKQLAETHGIAIQKASGGGFWVDIDLANDISHFAADMAEARQVIEDYLASKHDQA